MCFIVTDKRIYTAKEDIIVYKIMDTIKIFNNNAVSVGIREDEFRSHYRRFPYAVGYHYYNNNFPKGRTCSQRNLFGQGLHSYIRRKAVDYYIPLRGTTPYEIAVECYIPKGAKYMKNADEYISSDLVVVRPLFRRKSPTPKAVAR